MTYLLVILMVSLVAYFFLQERLRRHASRSGNLGLAALIGVAAVALFILVIAG